MVALHNISESETQYLSLPRVEKRLLGVASPECAAQVPCILSLGPASGGWPSINDPVAIPFVLPYGGTVVEIGVENGSVPSGNVDVGIYDTSFNRLVSTGSVAAAGASVFQWLNPADTVLPAGRYYLAMSKDTIAANTTRFHISASGPVMAFTGCMESATDSFPLPNPLSGMVAASTFTRVPSFAIAFRAHYA